MIQSEVHMNLLLRLWWSSHEALMKLLIWNVQKAFRARCQLERMPSTRPPIPPLNWLRNRSECISYWIVEQNRALKSHNKFTAAQTPPWMWNHQRGAILGFLNFDFHIDNSCWAWGACENDAKVRYNLYFYLFLQGFHFVCTQCLSKLSPANPPHPPQPFTWRFYLLKQMQTPVK